MSPRADGGGAACPGNGGPHHCRGVDPDAPHYCGPVALATTLECSGHDTSPAALAGRIYLPEREAALQAEVQAAACSAGRLSAIEAELATELGDRAAASAGPTWNGSARPSRACAAIDGLRQAGYCTFNEGRMFSLTRSASAGTKEWAMGYLSRWVAVPAVTLVAMAVSDSALAVKCNLIRDQMVTEGRQCIYSCLGERHERVIERNKHCPTEIYLRERDDDADEDGVRERDSLPSSGRLN
ncbi:MAG: hypothetical protein U5L11_00790 [Arhodomonas sp.]|nr:hypothetical protein [Arhodomonas sp.]